MGIYLKPYYLYIVECADQTYYTGITNNLERRLFQHNGLIPGGARYTINRYPVQLCYSQLIISYAKALIHERRIKKLNHRHKSNLIAGKV